MIKLFIIAGHGAGDPGACSDGYSEADLVRLLAQRLKDRGGDEVKIGDTSVNWHASDCISKGWCPAGVPVIELHMDSASSSARGGHVIIKDGLVADKYDNALSNFIGTFMPGRSMTLVARSNLANVNRAYRNGVNYRLLECGFISNENDRTKFINQMDMLADGILSAFGIGSNGSTVTESTTSSEHQSSSNSKKSADTIAREVIAGAWGNGSDRKAKLEAAGYNYNEVQAKVNELSGGSTANQTVDVDDLARRALAGEFGNGDDRKKNLGQNYEAVQKRVNEILGGASSSAKKSIDVIAREVIAGSWGNGNERRTRLEASGYNYNAVQKRVNELL